MDQRQILEQLKQNPQLLEKLANSADGKMLMTRLQQNGQELKQAAKNGQNGDLLAMAKMLRDVMADHEGRDLIDRLAKQMQK